MLDRVHNGITTDVLDRVALQIMRRGELIQHWHFIKELGLNGFCEYKIRIRQVPELALHVEALRYHWNSIVRQRLCTEVMLSLVRKRRVVPLGSDRFWMSTGVPHMCYEEFRLQNTVAKVQIKMHNRYVRKNGTNGTSRTFYSTALR